MAHISSMPAGLTTDRYSEARLENGADSKARPLSLPATWTILRFTFGLVPIIAGLDKFTDLLTNWDAYLNPLVLQIVPLGGHTFMEIAGVIEIIAGILTLARPRLGGYVVSAWLVCIALSLLAGGKYLDVAVRDLVMAIGAFTLANLTPFITYANSRRLS